MYYQILVVGKNKEKYINDGINKYLHLLNINHKIKIEEIKEEKITSSININKIKKIETEKLIKLMTKYNDYYKIILDVKGKDLDSIEFSQLINEQSISKGKVLFIIGGAYGFDQSIKEHINFSLSFSKMTFTHDMIRVMLLEQIYRAHQIIKKQVIINK